MLLRRLRMVCPLLVLSMLGLLAGPASANPDLEVFLGRWHRVSPDRDPARLGAIDAAVGDMSWVMRRIAGPILRNSTAPPPAYEIDITAQGLILARRDRAPRSLGLDGVEREIDGQRGPVRISSIRRAHAIESHWRTGEARGYESFRVADGGSTLVVESFMQITVLSGVQPIRYETHFTRMPQVASPPE